MSLMSHALRHDRTGRKRVFGKLAEKLCVDIIGARMTDSYRREDNVR